MARNKTFGEENVTAQAHLGQPYTRVLIPQPDGSYHAEITEFPGCFATGVTPQDAYEQLEAAALSWIGAVLQAGQPIPAPMDENDFSGKIVVRMPRSLHRKASFLAKRDDVSLNQFLVVCIAQAIGMTSGPSPQPSIVPLTGPTSNPLKMVKNR